MPEDKPCEADDVINYGNFSEIKKLLSPPTRSQCTIMEKEAMEQGRALISKTFLCLGTFCKIGNENVLISDYATADDIINLTWCRLCKRISPILCLVQEQGGFQNGYSHGYSRKIRHFINC